MQALIQTRLWKCRSLRAPAVAATVMAMTMQQASVAEVKDGGEGPPGSLPLQTTLNDYFQHGTQPMGAGLPSTFDPLLGSIDCSSCHANYGPKDPFTMVEIFHTWAPSMMAQSARDPLVHAAIAIANQSATNAGAFCIRCHAPVAFLNSPDIHTDMSAFQPQDFEGLSCTFCHRLVDPVFVPGTSPSQDEQILNDLATAGLMPPQMSNSRYLIDPTDSRRGPFDDIPLNVHPGTPQPEILHSPFHTKAEFCWTCHDVSNPLMLKQGDGSYALHDIDLAHPTGEQTQMLPLHRTYSEWQNSYYSTKGVQHDGRFGGNHPTGLMKSCQDCHMPRVEGYGCSYQFEPFFPRPDVPQHSFLGSNYWVLNAIRTVDADNNGVPDFPDSETFLSEELVNGAIARNIDFLEKASDLSLVRIGDQVRVRLINRTGHKMPTGFSDGRRIWINAKFFNCNQQLVQELGAYDFDTATLDTASTKVYEMELGIEGADYAQSIGQPEGHTMHFMLANTILKDNRIPPAGHIINVGLQNQTNSVGAFYQNLQNWDDTMIDVPPGATNAVVTIYYQLNSKEFIEFLRDENVTNNLGQVAYDLWVANGKSAPVVIDMAEVQVFLPEDTNEDGAVDVTDLLAVISAWGACNAPPWPCPGDVNNDGVVDVTDLLMVINAWGSC